MKNIQVEVGYLPTLKHLESHSTPVECFLQNYIVGLYATIPREEFNILGSYDFPNWEESLKDIVRDVNRTMKKHDDVRHLRVLNVEGQLTVSYFTNVGDMKDKHPCLHEEGMETIKKEFENDFFPALKEVLRRLNDAKEQLERFDHSTFPVIIEY